MLNLHDDGCAARGRPHAKLPYRRRSRGRSCRWDGIAVAPLARAVLGKAVGEIVATLGQDAEVLEIR
jgi:hypothetical protein